MKHLASEYRISLIWCFLWVMSNHVFYFPVIGWGGVGWGEGGPLPFLAAVCSLPPCWTPAVSGGWTSEQAPGCAAHTPSTWGSLWWSVSDVKCCWNFTELLGQTDRSVCDLGLARGPHRAAPVLWTEAGFLLCLVFCADSSFSLMENVRNFGKPSFCVCFCCDNIHIM